MYVATVVAKMAFAGLAFVTFTFGATMTGICTELESPCGGDPLYHFAPLMSEGRFENPHVDCKETSDNEWPVHWPDCQFSDDMVDQEAYDRAKQFAAVGDVQALIAAGMELPGYVRYNSSRNAVQLYACNGHSVASSLSVPDQLVQAAGLLD